MCASMALSVTKADGSKQLFEKEKIIRTCLRMGASREEAEAVAEKIERRAYYGIKSKQILNMIFRHLARYREEVKSHIDLRRALGLMRPKPDFEQFVHILLREHGYEVTPNLIVRGKCVEHEVDAIARKDGKTYAVEVKHHFNHHALTGLDVSRIARAIFEDITEGFKLALNSVNLDKATVISNTKYSDHAKRYGECRGIEQIGWNYPAQRGLEDMIEEKKLYPITYLKTLDATLRRRLAGEGIILLKQLVTYEPEALSRRLRTSRDRVDALIEKAKVILSYNP
nr:restriction endonuclease [Candidatus Njordarchaeum guaymaensis]